MTTTPQARRLKAIGDWMEDMCPKANEYEPRTQNLDEILKGLDELHNLGRTARWHNTINSVTQMVTEAIKEEDGFTLEWAIKQGSIFLCHAS